MDLPDVDTDESCVVIVHATYVPLLVYPGREIQFGVRAQIPERFPWPTSHAAAMKKPCG
jgi:hypothetical protein